MGFDAWNLVRGKGNGMSGVRSGQGTSKGGLKSKQKNSKRSTGSSKGRGSVSKSKGKSNRRNSGRLKPASIQNKISEEEKKWRAESDLRTLTDARDILDSPGRIEAAKKMAQERVQVAQEAAESVDKL